MRRKRIDLGQAPASEQLERTYSREEVMTHLGIEKDKLHELLQLGRKHHGCHPLKGGLWEWFKVSHKCVRITQSAIAKHKAHMHRLETDAMFAAQMRARARMLGERSAA